MAHSGVPKHSYSDKNPMLLILTLHTLLNPHNIIFFTNNAPGFQIQSAILGNSTKINKLKNCGKLRVTCRFQTRFFLLRNLNKKKFFVTFLKMCVRTPKCAILLHLIGNDSRHASAEIRVEHQKLKKNAATLRLFA